MIVGGVVLAVVILVASGTVVVTKLSRSNGTPQDGTTTTPFNGLTIVPTHPPEPTNFNAWSRVGGIDATFTDDGRTVRVAQYFMTPRSTAIWEPEMVPAPGPANQVTTSVTSSGVMNSCRPALPSCETGLYGIGAKLCR